MCRMLDGDEQSPETLTKFVSNLGSNVFHILHSAVTVTHHSSDESVLNRNVAADDAGLQKPDFLPAQTTALDDCRFRCTICRRLFDNKTCFESHVKSHRKVKQFQCNKCAKLFSTKQALRVHAFVHAKPFEDQFRCKHCSKIFQTKQNLQNHINIHLDVKPHKCAVCGETFREKSTLTKHLVTHKKLKSYSCHFCNQHFSQVSARQRHEKKMHIEHDVIEHDVFGGFLPALGAEVVAKELVLLENNP